MTYEPVARSEKIQLTVQEYEKIRAQPTCFVVHVGHDVPGVETVVETNERYALVKARCRGTSGRKNWTPEAATDGSLRHAALVGRPVIRCEETARTDRAISSNIKLLSDYRGVMKPVTVP